MQKSGLGEPFRPDFSEELKDNTLNLVFDDTDSLSYTFKSGQSVIW